MRIAARSLGLKDANYIKNILNKDKTRKVFWEGKFYEMLFKSS